MSPPSSPGLTYGLGKEWSNAGHVKNTRSCIVVVNFPPWLLLLLLLVDMLCIDEEEEEDINTDQRVNGGRWLHGYGVLVDRFACNPSVRYLLSCCCSSCLNIKCNCTEVLSRENAAVRSKGRVEE